MRKILILFVYLLMFLGVTGRVHATETELLTDPNFQNGVAVGYANTYPNDADQACIGRWQQILPGYNNIKWTFIEISERFYFCENSTNNPTIGTNLISYISPNGGIKKFTSNRNGTIRLEHDTSWEWRGGCNLSLPWLDVSPSQPRYGDSYTNWPHFLISQLLSPSYLPSQYDALNPNIIPLSERINLTKYNTLQFSGQFRLNQLAKIGSSQCPSSDWIIAGTTNHAIFYISFVLWRNTWNNPRVDNVPNVIYQLLPIVYSEDGTTNIGGQSGYLMGDQFGDRTYFAKLGEGVTINAKKLTINSPIFENISIDVAAFSRQILTSINPALNPNDYFVSVFLAGWEIWGGYKTDIEIKNLSLKGISDVSLPGDFTETGDTEGDHVNIYDYNLLVSKFGNPYTIFDYNDLVANYGR